MANKILTGTTYYAEIQSKLGVDANILPNTDIDARSVMNIAEARVIASVPDYTSLTGSDADYCYTAAICMVAAMLAPGMAARIKASEGDSDYKYTNAAVDWRQRSLELADESYRFIDLISTQTITELSQFGASGPTRNNAASIDPNAVITPNSADTLLQPDNSD